MNRKSFIKTALIAGTATTATSAFSKLTSKNTLQKQHQEFYELQVYSLKNQQQQKLVEDYLQQAAIPALNKLGSKSIGVFTELKPATDQTKVFVLIPYASLDAYQKVHDNLMKDAAYKQAGEAYLQAPLAEPAYERIESSLLQAFSTTPKIMLPEKKQRFFELRRYESGSEVFGKKKIQMFNEGGETKIFKDLGFHPVFFAETLIGEMRPNLTYMITFDSMEDHDAKWKAFGSNSDWKKISTSPEYPDKIVSRITSTFLTPTAYSQI